MSHFTCFLIFSAIKFRFLNAQNKNQSLKSVGVNDLVISCEGSKKIPIKQQDASRSRHTLKHTTHCTLHTAHASYYTSGVIAAILYIHQYSISHSCTCRHLPKISNMVREALMSREYNWKKSCKISPPFVSSFWLCVFLFPFLFLYFSGFTWVNFGVTFISRFFKRKCQKPLKPLFHKFQGIFRI